MDLQRGQAGASPRAVLFAFLVFLLALGLYLRTLAPSITWEHAGADSGDLVAAAFTGGVPHPPGYPLYLALAQLFIRLPAGGVAYRVNLLSAVSAAATILGLFCIARAFLAVSPLWRDAIAAASALLFAGSPLFWSQATIAEVYALNALLTLLLLAGLLLWAEEFGPRTRRARIAGQWLTAAALGLGLAHHPTILLMVPAGLLLLWGRVSLRSLMGTLAMSTLIAGLLYFTLVLRARGDPPVNWGDPQSVADVWWLVSAQLYRSNLVSLPLGLWPVRIAAWAKSLFEQFGAPGVALGLWGGLGAFRRGRRLGIALAAVFLVYSLFALDYATADSNVYLIPAFLVFAIWTACGFASLVAEWEGGSWRPSVKRVGRSLAALVLVLLPIMNAGLHFGELDVSRDAEAWQYGEQVFSAVPTDALIVVAGDRQTMALWYYRYVERPDSRVMVIAPGLLPYAWYREQLRRHHPGWNWPGGADRRWEEFLAALVQNNVERHAIYWTEPDAYFQQRFEFGTAGKLYRVTAMRSSDRGIDDDR